MERPPIGSAERKLKALLRGGGPRRSRELTQGGIHRAQLSRLVAAKKLQRVARGLYASPSYQGGEHRTLTTVAQRAPNSVFCLLTALRIHGLTTQAPFEVWIAIGNSDRPPRLDYPPLRIVRFSAASLSEGVETRRLEGVPVRVTTVAKTVADCFKFRNRIGLDVALEALREARRARRASPDDLWRFAKLNRVSNVMRPYLEATA